MISRNYSLQGGAFLREQVHMLPFVSKVSAAFVACAALKCDNNGLGKLGRDWANQCWLLLYNG